jgi:hypothetical protein
MLFIKEEISMNRRRMVITAIAAFTIAIGILRADSPAAKTLKKADLQAMIRNAHTVQQYQALATYFRLRQQAFKQQAHSELQELERRSADVTGPAAKYPRPVDSSRNRYEYFTYEAQQMSQQAAHYESLAATAAQ